MACDSGCQALLSLLKSYDHNSLVSMVVTLRSVGRVKSGSRKQLRLL